MSSLDVFCPNMDCPARGQVREGNMVLAVFVDAGSYTSALYIDAIEENGAMLRVTCKRFERPWPMINPAAVITVPRYEGEVAFEGCP